MQLDIDFARAQANEGMARALEHAESDVPQWGETALQWLRRYAESHQEFPGWFVTDSAALDPTFPTPADGRAWGAVWTKAQRLGIVRDSGKQARHPHRHASRAIVWASLVYRA